MRTATRIGLCTAVGTLALLLTGCTTHHHHGHPNPRPLPPGQARKYETYGHQKPAHVPPGQAKKQPTVARQQTVQQVQQQQSTNVRVAVYDSRDARQPVASTASPAPAPAAAPVVRVSEEQAYAGKSMHVPPGQVRKQETYGHQKEANEAPGKGNKDGESAQDRVQARAEHKQSETQPEHKPAQKPEQRQDVKRDHKQEQSRISSRGQAEKDDSGQETDQAETTRGNGKKSGKK